MPQLKEYELSRQYSASNNKPFITIQKFAREALETMKFFEFFRSNYMTEWENNLEIKESFPDHADYVTLLFKSVTGLDRDEWYIRDGEDIVAMICVSIFEDVHYRKAAGASLLWVLPAYRGDRGVLRLIINALEASAKMANCSYYVRTSKVTPFITKQIVRRV